MPALPPPRRPAVPAPTSGPGPPPPRLQATQRATQHRPTRPSSSAPHSEIPPRRCSTHATGPCPGTRPIRRCRLRPAVRGRHGAVRSHVAARGCARLWRRSCPTKARVGPEELGSRVAPGPGLGPGRTDAEGRAAGAKGTAEERKGTGAAGIAGSTGRGGAAGIAERRAVRGRGARQAGRGGGEGMSEACGSRDGEDAEAGTWTEEKHRGLLRQGWRRRARRARRWRCRARRWRR